MAVAKRGTSQASAGGKETELNWSYTTRPARFRSRTPQLGEVFVLDRSAIQRSQRKRKTIFAIAQIEGQKIYKR